MFSFYDGKEEVYLRLLGRSPAYMWLFHLLQQSQKLQVGFCVCVVPLLSMHAWRNMFLFDEKYQG